MAVLGVIGGSGVYDIPGLDITDSVKLTTPYGEPSDVYRIGKSERHRGGIFAEARLNASYSAA